MKNIDIIGITAGILSLFLFCAAGASAEDIELKGDIDPDGTNWEISFQSKHVASGGYNACFPSDTEGIATLCSDGFEGFNPATAAMGMENKIECVYADYKTALDKLITGLHLMADTTEPTYTVGFSGLSWTMYNREGTSAEGYTYTSASIPSEIAAGYSIVAGPADESIVGYEINLDLTPGATQWEANIQLQMEDKAQETDPDTAEVKNVTQYYYTFLKPQTDNPTPQAAYCSGDFSGFSWTRQTGEDASKTYDDEYSCFFDSYAEAYEYGLKTIHAFGIALQTASNPHLVKLSVSSYEMGTVVTTTSQKPFDTPLMTVSGSSGTGKAPKSDGSSPEEECPAVEDCPDCPASGEVSLATIIRDLGILTGK